MDSADKRLFLAAIHFGKCQKKARESQVMADRIKFVHAENRLGRAAQAIFEREQRRDARRRSKG